MISFDEAIELYDHHGRHSDGIYAITEKAKQVEITDQMISDALWEMGYGTKEQAWRVLACALRAGGFEVVK